MIDVAAYLIIYRYAATSIIIMKYS